METEKFNPNKRNLPIIIGYILIFVSLIYAFLLIYALGFHFYPEESLSDFHNKLYRSIFKTDVSLFFGILIATGAYLIKVDRKK